MTTDARARLLVTVMLAAPVVLHAQPIAGHEVARIAGSSIRCPAGDEAMLACARRVASNLRNDAERAFIDREGLHATAAEIAAVHAYDMAFRQQDREQRTRKLDELERRLRDSSLEDADRSRLQAFRDTLARLAQFETDVDAGLEAAATLDDVDVTRWVEQSKLDVALHRRYGGLVGIGPAGMYAHGARAALLQAHLLSLTAHFIDPKFEAALHKVITAPPLLAAPSGAADFTPYWLRPIPASYMPN